MTDDLRLVRSRAYRIMLDKPAFGGLDPALLVAKFAAEIAEAAMAGIDKATCDQGQHATLHDRSLREAILAGVTRYLSREIEKHRRRTLGEGSPT